MPQISPLSWIVIPFFFFLFFFLLVVGFWWVSKKSFFFCMVSVDDHDFSGLIWKW